jgi:hypothetical protein
MISEPSALVARDDVDDDGDDAAQDAAPVSIAEKTPVPPALKDLWAFALKTDVAH